MEAPEWRDEIGGEDGEVGGACEPSGEADVPTSESGRGRLVSERKERRAFSRLPEKRFRPPIEALRR